MATLQREVRAAWSARSTQEITRAIVLPIATLPARTAAVATSWSNTGRPLTAARRAAWSQYPARTAPVSLAWSEVPAAARLAAARVTAWSMFPPRTRAGRAAWRDHAPTERHTVPRQVAWEQGHPNTAAQPLRWADVERARSTLRPRPRPPYQPEPPWEIDAYCPPGWPLDALAIVADFRLPLPANPVALSGSILTPWRQGQPSTQARRIVWGPCRTIFAVRTATPWEDDRQIIWIPRRRSYLMLHEVELVRVSDQQPIPVSALTIRADADSWADTLSATCHGPDAMDLLTAAVGVELEARIDGRVWRLVADRPKQTQSFGSRSINLTARSLTALLAQPFQDPASYTEPAARTAAQLATGRLPEGGGWSLIWNATDWLVPAGAWQYLDLPPMAAIADVVAAVQGVIRPSRTARTLTVQPRYPVLPWDYATVSPTRAIPDGAFSQFEERSQRPEQADAVWVEGGQVGGIQARLYRTGSAGDRLAKAGQHPLITHSDAARALGSAILAGQVQSSRIASLVLPCDNGSDWDLVEVGDLLLIERWGGVRDTVSAVQLDVRRNGNGITVRQSVTLGTDTGNAFSRLRRLVSDRVTPLLVGEVQTAHADGTVTVAYPSGGTQRVSGTAAVGAKVWVQEGMVRGPAPEFPAYDLAV